METKLLIYPEVSDASVDYAIGLENGYMWFSTPSSSSLDNRGYRWYAGTSCVMEVSSKIIGSIARIRVIPTSDLGESSIAYFSYTDKRVGAAGDLWSCGANAWGVAGYCIGTTVYGSCLNIRLNCDVDLRNQLYVNNINILDSLNLKAVASDVYTKTEIDTSCYTKTECYGRSETYTRIETSNLITGTFTTEYPIMSSLNLTTRKLIISMSPDINTALDGKADVSELTWKDTSVAPPRFTTRSLGTKLLLKDAVGPGAVDYAIGVDTNNLWLSVPTSTQTHRFYCGLVNVFEILPTYVIATGRICNKQVNQSVLTTAGSTTLTIAQLVVGIIQMTQAAAVTFVLPTGTLTFGGGFGIDQSIDWTVINTGSSLGAISVTAAVAHSIVGSGTVAINTSGSFRTRITASNVAITYRIS